MPKWMSGFVVKRLTTKAIMAAKKHSIQGELIWLTGITNPVLLIPYESYV